MSKHKNGHKPVKNPSRSTATPSVTSARTTAVSPAVAPARPASQVEGKTAEAGRAISSQAIAEAAYYLWQKRGGSEVLNWLEAERQLLAGKR